ncbi:hypothetical protein Q3G72_013146 [Acer saccharum]|nr:hypothetical protein Q3G72_013146 [Acer saccharum]
MYAYGTSKGNVVELKGMIEIKFRTKELLECMGRLDQVHINLKEKLQEATSNRAPAMVESLQQLIKASKENAWVDDDCGSIRCTTSTDKYWQFNI